MLWEVDVLSADPANDHAARAVVAGAAGRLCGVGGGGVVRRGVVVVAVGFSAGVGVVGAVGAGAGAGACAGAVVRIQVPAGVVATAAPAHAGRAL